jgi:hypothetical protein
MDNRSRRPIDPKRSANHVGWRRRSSVHAFSWRRVPSFRPFSRGYMDNAGIRIELPLIDKLLNLANTRTRKMRCACQKEFTEHVAVSFADCYRKSQKGERFFARIFDLVPLWPLLSGNPYACTKCGRVKRDGGLFADIENP